VVRVATEADREVIYRLRHEVYAQELGQHAINAQRRLTDALDNFNTYFVGEVNGEIAGFISVTPPGGPGYSIDKYFRRDDLPLSFDDGLYELRLLTVVSSHRQGPLAGILMREAYQWVRDHGGRWIVAIGRREVVDLYRHVGLKTLGRSVQAGAVTFDLMAGTVDDVGEALRPLKELLARFDRKIETKPRRSNRTASIEVVHGPATPCDHGGAFFAALGDEFDKLATKDRIINADVLDAWFDPAPEVVEALRQDMGWMLKTSPPTGCDGFLRAISRARGVPVESLVPGAGSSALIFAAFQRWLTRESRVLVLDPMYGEYAHVLEHVVGCRVDRLKLSAEDGFKVDLGELARMAGLGYDLVVLVNPNNPTGRHIPANELREVLETVPRKTRVWIDETYSDYAAAGAELSGDGALGMNGTGRKPCATLEHFAAASENVVVCKSLSKVLALSGARAAYLCGPAKIAADLRSVTPPWAVSLPAQVAALAALKNPVYYKARYEETHRLRTRLAASLRGMNLEVFDGVINSVLCRLPESAPTAAEVVAACRERGVFIRDCTSISGLLSPRWIRVAVKDEAGNARVMDCLRAVLGR
jgi:histidinol-phosphate/aromatic aminotransferase/cobyric acid decarboxylase-like protein/GNAT superfamily N-acetyltransferase